MELKYHMTNYELGLAIKFSTEVIRASPEDTHAFRMHHPHLELLLQIERQRASSVEVVK